MQHTFHDEDIAFRKLVTNTNHGILEMSISIVHEQYGVDKSKWKDFFLMWSFMLNVCGFEFTQHRFFVQLHFRFVSLKHFIIYHHIVFVSTD